LSLFFDYFQLFVEQKTFLELLVFCWSNSVGKEEPQSVDDEPFEKKFAHNPLLFGVV